MTQFFVKTGDRDPAIQSGCNRQSTGECYGIGDTYGQADLVEDVKWEREDVAWYIAHG